MTIDQIIQKTLAGLITVAEAELQLETFGVRGGFGWADNKPVSYAGYNYANQSWIGLSSQWNERKPLA